MSRDDIQKLLGGYATGSLTPEEHQALFNAALEDQTLFDELAREETLRATLSDPAARAEVLAALDDVREPWHRRALRWFGRPIGLAALAGTATAIITIGVWVNYRAQHLEPALVTAVRPPAATNQAVVKDQSATPAPQEKAAPKPAPKKDQEKFLKAQNEAPAEQAPAEQKETAVGVVGGVPGGVAGGVPGGVLGGILPRQQEVIPPPPAARLSPMPVTAPPPPPPPRPSIAAPPVALEKATTPPATQSARALFDSPTPRQFSLTEGRQDAAPRPLRSTIARKAKRAEAPAVNVPHLGIRYSVLRLGAGGGFDEIDPATIFSRGDQVRLAFEANDAGYLYVLQREAGGGWRLLASEQLDRRVRRIVPGDGAIAYDEPGAKQLYVFFTRQPDPTLASANPTVLDARVRGSLLVQKGEGTSTYVVSTGAIAQAQQLGHTITLNYR